MKHLDDKLRELILYVAERCEGDHAFGKIKLNKILFYADFEAYTLAGRSITGEVYKKLPMGPVPPRVDLLLQEMDAAGEIAVANRSYFGKPQQRPMALREARLESFGGQEIAIVDKVISALWGKSGRDVSDLSHEFIGWQVARMGEVIPYETALIDTSPWTPEEEEWALRAENRRVPA